MKLTKKQAAQRAGVSERTINRCIESGRLTRRYEQVGYHLVVVIDADELAMLYPDSTKATR